MSDETPDGGPAADEAALMVVDLLDAIGQCGSVISLPLEDRILARLQQVSACEALPDSMRALAGRLVADHVSRTARSDRSAHGQWLIH